MANSKIVNVNIAFRNIDPTDALRTYAAEKISHCLQKFVHHDTEAHVVLKVEKNSRQIAEVTFRTDGADFAGHEQSEDMYTSIDSLINNITRQLSKHKEKITSHHKPGARGASNP